MYHADGDAIGALITKKDPERRVVVWRDERAFHAGLFDAEVLVLATPPAAAASTMSEAWGRAASLRLIQLMGVGADDLLASRGEPVRIPDHIAISCLRGVFAAEVADHVFALLLALVRGVPALTERQRARQWKPFASSSLAGKTMTIVGAGAVGSRVARRAEGFEMKARLVGRDVAQRSDDLDSALRDADVVVLAAPRTALTTNLLDRRRVGLLRSGALVINVARGGIVDDHALLEAIMSGALGGAALDVFDEEPLSKGSPWWSAPNVIVTPHVAGYGLDYEAKAVDVLLDNVRRIERGSAPAALVNRDLGY